MTDPLALPPPDRTPASGLIPPPRFSAVPKAGDPSAVCREHLQARTGQVFIRLLLVFHPWLGRAQGKAKGWHRGLSEGIVLCWQCKWSKWEASEPNRSSGASADPPPPSNHTGPSGRRFVYPPSQFSSTVHLPRHRGTQSAKAAVNTPSCCVLCPIRLQTRCPVVVEVSE